VSQTEITITFDPDRLGTCTDQYLAMLWHLTQLKVWGGGHDFSGDLSRKQLARQLLDVVMPGQDAAAGQP